MANSAKCPRCNAEFTVEYGEHTLVCPQCGEQMETIRARKYYQVFHNKTVDRDIHGKEYFQYDEYLRVGDYHLSKNEFDQAKSAFISATNMNPGDYRGFMGLVAAETKNYTDLKNTSHQQYLRRAISVADDAQQKIIAETYKIYNAKASMSDAEYSEYVSEKQKDFKARIKKAIIGLAKVNDSQKKKSKNAFITMCVLIGVGTITLVLGFVFAIVALIILGALIGFGSYALTFVWQKQKYNERMYEFLVTLFNELKDFSLAADQTDKILDYMSAMLISLRDGDATSVTDKIIEEFTLYAADLNDKNLDKFLKTQKITSKYIKR